MSPQTQKKQYNRRTNKKRDIFTRVETLAFVPRHISLKFMAIEGVADVKPALSNLEWIKIVVIPKQGGYNHELQSRILQVECEIAQSLRSRRQKFEASISW